MRYLDEFRDATLAENLSARIADIVKQEWTIMEVCGGQTHSILQYGIEDLLPDLIELVHGPGCPVCVTPVSLIDTAVEIAMQDDVTLMSYGDMLRVPGSKLDLLEAKALGADVRMVYSPLDCLDVALKNPDRQVVFFAVGFETTAPANAMVIVEAKRQSIQNFSVLCSHVTVPQVCSAILQAPGNQVQALIGPGHVCSIMGFKEYEPISRRYKIPIVVTGFEPIDLLEGILLCAEELEEGRHGVVNQYRRAVVRDGNRKARETIESVFDVADREWRGLGWIPKSGYKINHRFRHFDALSKFQLAVSEGNEPAECVSGQILRGLKKPTDCTEFGTTCTPDSPLGATMVSAEGTCANYYKFRRVEA